MAFVSDVALLITIGFLTFIAVHVLLRILSILTLHRAPKPLVSQRSASVMHRTWVCVPYVVSEPINRLLGFSTTWLGPVPMNDYATLPWLTTIGEVGMGLRAFGDLTKNREYYRRRSDGLPPDVAHRCTKSGVELTQTPHPRSTFREPQSNTLTSSIRRCKTFIRGFGAAKLWIISVTQSPGRKFLTVVRTIILVLLHVLSEVFANLVAKMYLYFAAINKGVTLGGVIWEQISCPSFGRVLDPQDPDVVVTSKQVLFVRHGESVWNAVFNKGRRVLLPFRLLGMVLWELLLLCERDSVVLDSPLSPLGIKQAQDLQGLLNDVNRAVPSRQVTAVSHFADRELSALTENGDRSAPHKTGRAKNLCLNVTEDAVSPDGTTEHVEAGWCGDETKRHMVDQFFSSAEGVTIFSSNLRRSVSTAIIFCQHWLKTQCDTSACRKKIVVSNLLEEYTRNFDGFGLSRGTSPAEVSQLERSLTSHGMVELYLNHLDIQHKTGTLPISTRIQQFFRWLFDDCASGHVVIVGHSLWFRRALRLLLPAEAAAKHQSKKLGNCSAIRFEIVELKKGHVREFRTAPESLTLVQGGYE